MGTSVLNIHLDRAEDLRYEIYKYHGQLVSIETAAVQGSSKTIHLERPAFVSSG